MMDETKELLLAIKHAIEVVDAKVTALQEEQNYTRRDIQANTESIQLIHEKLDHLQKHGNKLGRHINAVESDLDNVILRVDTLETRSSLEF